MSNSCDNAFYFNHTLVGVWPSESWECLGKIMLTMIIHIVTIKRQYKYQMKGIRQKISDLVATFRDYTRLF